MKKYVLLLLILFFYQWCYSDDFVRNLPNKKLVSVITASNFPTEDAVIILKEQSYRVERTAIDYRQYEINGLQTVKSKILIVKMLNEKAVKRYGTFEYTYYERYGSDFPCKYDLYARILKENGKVIKVKKKEVQNIILQKDDTNRPLYRKIICKFPSLSVGDVLQIEFHISIPFTYYSDEIFYYNDHDFVLYSNLYITLARELNADYLSFPSEKVGKPQITQASKKYGSGKTYFWSLRNLASIPEEPFSRPFEDRSIITAFVLHNKRDESQSWLEITKNYYDKYLKKKIIPDAYLTELGLDTIQVENDSINFDLVNYVYRAIRKTFKLRQNNYLFPNSDGFKSIFRQKKGGATDLAYVFFKILKKWEVDAKPAFIRDKREGIFEESVPSLNWFSRIGVYVTLNGVSKIYDFDASIPNNYSLPWYLNDIVCVVFDNAGYVFEKIGTKLTYKTNRSLEFHKIEIDSTGDYKEKVTYTFTGSASQKLRNKLYDIDPNDQFEVMKAANLNIYFEQLDSIKINDYMESSNIILSCYGKTNLKVDSIGNSLLIKLDPHLLEKFREKIFSVIRRSDYYFHSPFQISCQWEVQLPRGYKISDEVIDRAPFVKFQDRMNAKVVYSLEENTFSIKMDLTVPIVYLPCKKHGELIKFLDNIIDYVGRDIVFEKISG